jgi:hypothetical protein
MSALAVQQLPFLADPLVAHMMIAIQVQGDELTQLIEQNKVTTNKVHTYIQQTLQQFQASSTHLDVLLKEIGAQNAELEQTQNEEMLKLEKMSDELEATLAAQKVEEEGVLSAQLDQLVGSIRVIKNECSLIRGGISRYNSDFIGAQVDQIVANYVGWHKCPTRGGDAHALGYKVLFTADRAEFEKLKRLYPRDF